MALTWLCSFQEPERLLARWIENHRKFDFKIKHEAGKKNPHADCMSRVPPTDDNNDPDQVNRVNLEDKYNWFIGLGQSVDKFVEHQKIAAELIVLRIRIGSGKRHQKKTWQELLEHCGNFGKISKAYE